MMICFFSILNMSKLFFQYHIAICFVAFSLIRFLQYIIKQHLEEHFSAEQISEEFSEFKKEF
jgi:hypothetical protein